MNWSFYIKYKHFEAGLKIQRNYWIKASLAIIGIGGTILSTPLWMEVANAFSIKYFNLTLLDGYSWLYGFICIAIGICVLIYGQKVTVDSDLKVKHDISIFNQMETILSEARQNAILSNLVNDHSYYNDEDTIFHNLFYFVEQTGNKFLNRKIQTKSQNYINALKAFDTFAKSEFDIFPRTATGNFRLCLKPNWNIDRGLDIPDIKKELDYDKLGEKLDELISSIRLEYSKFRQAIAKQLFI